MKKNNYYYPPVKAYSHHAFPLSVILSNPHAFDWFLCNYIYVYFGGNINKYNFLVQYSNQPFLSLRDIHKKEFPSTMTHTDYYTWIRNKIEDDYLVLLFIDEYYLPKSEHYLFKHIPHEILVVGYDTDNCIYLSYINNILKENSSKWQDIIISSDEYWGGNGIVAKLYSSRNGQFQYDENLIMKQLKDYLYSHNPYSDLAIWGDYYHYKDFIYGTKANDMLLDYTIQEGYFDMRYFDVVFEHKKCMHSRLQVMYNRNDAGIITEKDLAFWKDILNKSKLLLNRGLKYNIKYDTDKLPKMVLANLIDDYKRLFESEGIWLKSIIK